MMIFILKFNFHGVLDCLLSMGFGELQQSLQSKNLCLANGSTLLNADVINCTNFHKFFYVHKLFSLTYLNCNNTRTRAGTYTHCC